MRKVVLFIVTTLLMLVFIPRDTLADSQASNRVTVDHVATVLEKFKEKITLFFKFSKEEKFNYNQYLVEKRLAELKYVVDSKKGDLVEETSSRYTTYLGNFTDFAVKNSFSNKKDELLIMYKSQKTVLEELQKNFEFESGFWLLLQHGINSTNIFSTQVTEKL